MKKIAIASVLLASVLLAACEDERAATPPVVNSVDDIGNSADPRDGLAEPAPYPGDRK